MLRRQLLALLAIPLLAGCASREVEKDLQVTDMQTGWYDAGFVEGNLNKLVPSVSFRLENISADDIASVQMNGVFRRVGEVESWGEHFVSAIDSDGLAAGATGGLLVLRSPRGYTGTQTRLQMLQNREFIDAKVELYGKHGSRPWVKMAEIRIERQLLTE